VVDQHGDHRPSPFVQAMRTDANRRRMLNQSRPVARTEVAFGRCCASQPGDGEASELFQVGAITLSTYAHAFAAPTTSPADSLERRWKAAAVNSGERPGLLQTREVAGSIPAAPPERPLETRAFPLEYAGFSATAYDRARC